MQKIVPSLWFEDKCEEAISLYVGVFNTAPGKKVESKIMQIQRYPEGIPNPPWGENMKGKVLTAIFELEGQRFIALDGGPVFKFNPTVSFIINCSTPDEADHYWNKLVEGGSVMMPIQKYPFSERYGWLSDKYGVSWQIGVIGQVKDKITPSLMFVGDKFGKAEEAINFYTSVFKSASVEMIARYEPGEHDEAGKIKFASLILEGQQFRAMESSLGHAFTSNGAISFLIECQTQEEVDYYWEKLTQGGDPKARQCGWLQDQYGFSWQVIPKILGELLSDPDKEKANRVMQAMLKMKKINIAALEKAAEAKQ